MNKLQTYKLYWLVKKHFTNKKFNVFEDKKRFVPIANFNKRNDVKIFYAIGTKFDNPKKFIEFSVANISIGKLDFIYNMEDAQDNYIKWKSYQESLSFKFTIDLHIIKDFSEKNQLSFIQSAWKCWQQKMIHIQTISLLYQINNEFLNSISESNNILYEDEILRIKKLSNFVKTSEKIFQIYSDFQ